MCCVCLLNCDLTLKLVRYKLGIRGSSSSQVTCFLSCDSWNTTELPFSPATVCLARHLQEPPLQQDPPKMNGRRRTASPKCKGYKPDGDKCPTPAKPDYDFCCSQHDPQFVYIKPDTFTKNNLRREKGTEIIRLYEYRDIYANAPLPSYDKQLDHIWERQCLSHALARVSEQYQDRWTRSGELVGDLTKFVCTVANENDNLAFTKTSINGLKGTACWKFLDDSLTGHRAPDQALHSYLLAAHEFDIFSKMPPSQRVRLQRQETKRICNAMGRAVKICQRKIDNESDGDVVWESYNAQLQQMYVDMQLK